MTQDAKISDIKKRVKERKATNNKSSNLVVVNSIKDYPELSASKKPLDTHKNLEWLLEKFNAEIRYNMMSRKREIILPQQFISSEDSENSALFTTVYLATLNGMPLKQIDNHLNFISLQNAYHPIVKCIADKPWDGIERLDYFISTIKSATPDIDKLIIKTWMVAGIASAHSVNGFANQGVLVLQGKQGIGKTSWVKSLDPINCGAIKDGALLDPSQKDSVIGLSSFWIVELGELDATLNKTDIARLKSFITSHADDVRFSYARRSTRLPRRTIYVATVNESQFLVDTTGNRRWWVISAEGFDLSHNLDMQQVWAEVYAIWKKGALPYLPNDLQEAVNETNKKHEKTDPLKEKLLTTYDWSTQRTRQLTATDVLIEIGHSHPSRGEATAMGKLLIEINGKEGYRSNGVTKHGIPAKLDQYYSIR